MKRRFGALEASFTKLVPDDGLAVGNRDRRSGKQLCCPCPRPLCYPAFTPAHAT